MLENESAVVLNVASIPCDADEGCEGTWVLDVCLDYFAVKNPFYDDISHNLRECMRRLGDCAPNSVRNVIEKMLDDDGLGNRLDESLEDLRDR